MHGKAPTRKQKMILEENGMNNKEYLVLRDLVNTMAVKHRRTGEIKIVEK